MALKSLGRPIENIDDRDEARVLALINHLEPMVAAWRDGQDLRAVQDQMAQTLSARRTDLQAAQDKSHRLATEHKSAGERATPYLAVAVVAGVIGLLILLGAQGGLKLLGLLIAAGGCFSGYLWRQAQVQTSALLNSKTATEKAIADLDQEIKSLEVRTATIEEELSRRSEGFPAVVLADVRFPLELRDIAGHNLLIDRSGTHASIAFRAVDVSALQSGAANIAEKLEALREVPPMLSLSSASASSDPLERLYGEENELSELVTDFTFSLGQLRDVTIELPVVSPTSELSRRLASGDTSTPHDGGALTIVGDAPASRRIADFIEEVTRSREQGRQVFIDLQAAYDRLSESCRLYAQARSQSVNTLHASWLDVLQRSTWCNRRFYCARTIMSPAYLEDLLGVSLDEAYRLDGDDLIERLNTDPTISERLRLKPELEAQLREAHAGVWAFIDQGIYDDSSAGSAARPRHIEELFRENTQAFRRSLQKAATGSAFPLLNYSSEAVLFFDPDTEEWSSELSPYTYRIHDVLRYGSVLKAYSDLMVPLWEHLWTEKADFRKSETFRTNEQLIRMSEKEAEKLIDIANQFRGDMRPIRENLNHLSVELRSKTQEITHFKQGMETLGLLSDRARESIEQRGELLTEDIGDTSGGPDKFETILAAQPQAQMESRGVVQDPIDLVRGVDALLAAPVSPRQRLLPA